MVGTLRGPRQANEQGLRVARKHWQEGASEAFSFVRPSPPAPSYACGNHRDLSPRNVIGEGPVRGSENQHRPHRSYVPDEGSVWGRSESSLDGSVR